MDNWNIRVICVVYFLLCCGVWYLWRKERYAGRRYWRHPSLVLEEGEYNTLFKFYKSSCHDRFFRYCRMEVWQFDELLNLLKRRLTKRSLRLPVPPEEQLAMTLRFLAHGGDLVTLAESYRRGLSTVQKIVKETCEVIWEELSPLYVNVPDKQGWKQKATQFWARWNFPNCFGALDGKHVDFVAPPNSGTTTFNHHRRHSLVLMALCDAQYQFTYVDMGSYGSQFDSTIFCESVFGQDLLSGNLDLPEEQPLPMRDAPCFPFWIVADQAFPLSQHILRPYPGRYLTETQRVFNYRLSRARRCIENAFGILVNRWRLLRTRFQAFPETTDAYVKACIALHNFVMRTQREGTSLYCPPNYVDQEDQNGVIIPGAWRAEARPEGQPLFHDIGRVGANNPGVPVQRIRDRVARYFMSDDGAVEWQLRAVYAGYQ